MRKLSISKRSIALCLIVQIAITACDTAREIPDPISIDERHLNRQIRLSAPAYFNSFKTTDWVTLEVTFQSDKEIRFPNYFGVRIFELSPSGWTEIGELPNEHYPQADQVFSPQTGPYRNIMAVSPKLSDRQGSHRVRIYIIGEMQDGAQTNTVAAYIDLDLHP